LKLATISQEYFNDFRQEIGRKIDCLSEKLDKIIDPETGLYRKLWDFGAKVEKEHLRLDEFAKELNGNGKKGINERLESIERALPAPRNRFKSIGDIVLKTAVATITLGLLGFIWFVISNYNNLMKIAETLNK
jgi:hypothetical protein